MLFRVLGSLGFVIFKNDTSNFELLPFIHVDVAGNEVSGGYFCDTLINSDPVLDRNLETFSSRIQGPPNPLGGSISVVL